MKKQTENFRKESLRYVSSYLNDESKGQFLKDEEIFESFTPTNVLDVGCGNGNSLESIVSRFNCNGSGVEPSSEAIELLKHKFKDSKKMSFYSSSAHSLPFEIDSFDLVWAWSVLHWVGRNEYLQALGELVRVSSKYLIIMDFVADEDYRTPYRHDKNFYTYKMDFESAILSTGIIDKVYEKRWWVDPNEKKEKLSFISESQLKPFLGNAINYHSRKMVVFEKNYNRLQTLDANDF